MASATVTVSGADRLNVTARSVVESAPAICSVAPFGGRVSRGHDVDDWLQAEYELIQLPVRKLAEMEPPVVPRGKARSRSIVELVRTAMY